MISKGRILKILTEYNKSNKNEPPTKLNDPLKAICFTFEEIEKENKGNYVESKGEPFVFVFDKDDKVKEIYVQVFENTYVKENFVKTINKKNESV